MSYEQLKLKNQLCFRLYATSRLIVQKYDAFLKDLGLTYTQYIVMLVLWEKDHQPVDTIGQTLKLGINTTSPLMKRLESMGLVTRSVPEQDKRQRIISLTEKGKALKRKAGKIPGCMGGMLESCGITYDFMTELVQPLDEMIDKLTRSE